MAASKHPPVGTLEQFGLLPLGPTLKDMRLAVFGAGKMPKTQWGPSSTLIFKPQLSVPTWLGQTRKDRRAPIYNYFNRVPAPIDEGYSVKVSYCRDFRGGQWCYDGHVGTDFAIPVGTPVATAAEGVVLRVSSEMDRGGIKVGVDHGGGLFTTYCHLSRVLVKPGQTLKRGEVLGLSGASGMEFFLFFPWVAPHLHFNVWLNGEPVDPFAKEGETSLWLEGNDPTPAGFGESKAPQMRIPSEWNFEAVAETIEHCTDGDVAARLRAISDPLLQAGEVLCESIFRSPIFPHRPSLYLTDYRRQGRMDLPFSKADFVGVAHGPCRILGS